MASQTLDVAGGADSSVFIAIAQQLSHVLSPTQRSLVLALCMSSKQMGMAGIAKALEGGGNEQPLGKQSREAFKEGASQTRPSGLGSAHEVLDGAHCGHCKQPGHAKVTCFDLIGRPDWWKGTKDRRERKRAQKGGERKRAHRDGLGEKVHEAGVSKVAHGDRVGEKANGDELGASVPVVASAASESLRAVIAPGKAGSWWRRQLGNLGSSAPAMLKLKDSSSTCSTATTPATTPDGPRSSNNVVATGNVAETASIKLDAGKEEKLLVRLDSLALEIEREERRTAIGKEQRGANAIEALRRIKLESERESKRTEMEQRHVSDVAQASRASQTRLIAKPGTVTHPAHSQRNNNNQGSDGKMVAVTATSPSSALGRSTSVPADKIRSEITAACDEPHLPAISTGMSSSSTVAEAAARLPTAQTEQKHKQSAGIKQKQQQADATPVKKPTDVILPSHQVKSEEQVERVKAEEVPSASFSHEAPRITSPPPKFNVSSLKQLKHVFMDVRGEGFEDERDVALQIFLEEVNNNNGPKVIICNTREKVDSLTTLLRENKYMVSVLHEGMDQQQQTVALRVFSLDPRRILITTHELARRLDLQQVQLTINHDFPSSREAYIQRLTRIGQLNRKGVVVSLAYSSSDFNMLGNLRQDLAFVEAFTPEFEALEEALFTTQ